MAVTTSTIADPLGTKLIIDANSNATDEDDVTSGASAIIYAVEIDNTENNAATYTKLHNNANAVVGTTPPELQFKVAAQAKQTYMIGTGYTVAQLSFWSVTSAFALTGSSSAATTPPASTVKVKILCTF